MSGTLTDPIVEAAPPLPRRSSPWLWRLGAVLVLLAAGGILYWGNTRAEVTQPTGTGDLVVRKLSPGRDAKALRQTEIGADLQAGFDGRLTINGREIPEEQMAGVADQSSPEVALLPADQPSRLRPNNRNRVFFQPGPGKVIEKLPQGEVTITVTYFRDGQPTVGRGSLTWTINVI